MRCGGTTRSRRHHHFRCGVRIRLCVAHRRPNRTDVPAPRRLVLGRNNKQNQRRATTRTFRIDRRIRISCMTAATASPDHSWPPRYRSAWRTLHCPPFFSTAAARCAAVFLCQRTSFEMSERTSPTDLSASRRSCRTVSVRSVSGTLYATDMETPPTQHNSVMISIELRAKLRNLSMFLADCPRMCGELTCDNFHCKKVVPVPCSCHTSAKKTDGGGDDEGYRRAVDSCARAFRLQEGFKGNLTAGNIAQPLGEAEGRFFSAGADITQVPFRAISGRGKLADGSSVVAGPAKHGM